MQSLREKIDYSTQYFNAVAPLFNRIVDEDFNEGENEFRVLFRMPRRVNGPYYEILRTNPIQVKCADQQFEVDLPINVDENTLDSVFPMRFIRSDNGVVLSIEEMAAICDHPELISRFFNLDIRDTAKQYGYIGDRDDCLEFVDEYLNGTINLNVEDENHHVHHGGWKNNLHFHGIPNDSKGETAILRLPEKGAYSWFGPGFRQEFFTIAVRVGV